jgi:hypothetical protein
MEEGKQGERERGREGEKEWWKEKVLQYLLKGWRKECNSNVLQFLPEAKFPCTLTGSDSTDKEGLNSGKALWYRPRWEEEWLD